MKGVNDMRNLCYDYIPKRYTTSEYYDGKPVVFEGVSGEIVEGTFLYFLEQQNVMPTGNEVLEAHIKTVAVVGVGSGIVSVSRENLMQ